MLNQLNGQISKRNSLRNLSSHFNKLISPLKESNYEKLLITFGTRTFLNSFISPTDLEHIVFNSFIKLESNTLRPILRKWKINYGLSNSAILCFPKLAFIHSTDQFDKENHIHVLVLMAKNDIPQLEKLYKERIATFCQNNNCDIKPKFHNQVYGGDSYDFLSYVTRKDYDSDNNSCFDSHSAQISRSYFGFYSNDNHDDNNQQPFISLHKKYSSTITQSNKPTLEEVRDALQDQIISSIYSPEAKFTLIKSDVGTGKSYITNSLPKIFRDKRILVLVKRIENYTNFSNFTSLPSIPKQLEDFFEENSSKGIHSYKIFEDLEPTTPRLKSLKEIYLKHKKSTEEILATNQFIVATHSKFFLSSLNSQNFDHIIFDECLIDSMFRESFVKANELTALRNEKSFLIKDLLKPLDEMKIGEIKSFIDPSLTTKISNLLEAESEKLAKHLSYNTHPPISHLSVLKHFQNEFHVLKLENEYQVLSNFQFPSSSSKYLILSATAPSEIYKKLFEKEIKIIESPRPQIKAEIYQHTSFNLTKHSLEEKRSEAMLKLHEYSENDYKTISFKELEPDAHFHSLSSNNNLTGQNLVIIGTPNPNLNHFKLLLHAVGFENPEIKPYNELNYEEDTYRNRRIYYFKVSNDQKINEIYYSMIESELIQALGRTRPFEHESKVVIFSSFTLNEYARIR